MTSSRPHLRLLQAHAGSMLRNHDRFKARHLSVHILGETGVLPSARKSLHVPFFVFHSIARPPIARSMVRAYNLSFIIGISNMRPRSPPVLGSFRQPHRNVGRLPIERHHHTEVPASNLYRYDHIHLTNLIAHNLLEIHLGRL